ncbi:ABC transporter ATP-binding protein [Clostridium sp.]
MSENNKNNKSDGGGMGRSGGPMGSFKGPVVKAKDFKGTLKRLLSYLKPQRTNFILVFIFAIISTIFTIVGPKISAKAIDKLIEGIMGKFGLIQLSTAQSKIDAAIKANPMAAKSPKVIEGLTQIKDATAKIMSLNGGKIDFTYIRNIILVLLGLYVVSTIFGFLQQYIMAEVAQKTVYNLRKEVEDKLSRLPLKFFDARTHGEILSRVTNDVDNISTTLQQSLTQLITSIVTIIGIIVMMLTISPLMTLVVILTLPLYIVVTAFVAKRSQKYFAAQQKEIGQLNGHVEEMYTGHKIVKSFGHEKDSIEEFKNINDRLYNAGWKAQFISGIIMPMMRFVSNIGYVVVCVVGGFLATQGKITIGNIQAFIQYSSQFTQPIVQTANIANIIQSTVASAERIFELLDEDEEIVETDDNKVIEIPMGEVKFENVDFSYSSEESLIKNMNIDVKRGHTIAIVGPTGAGKTTLVNLLMRFYEIDAGKITVDGVDIRDIKRGELRNMFGMVLQDTWLFNGTIMENIAYGKEGATDEEVMKAARAAHAHHFIKTLPDGYKTILNEEASNISQGQKQLLTIARAILANPTIMILDEATSNVDSRTEVYIQKAMTELMKNRTSFVIAHRLSTIKGAELILVMNKGSIIEMGNHNELLAQKGFYEDLYNSQFAGADLDNEVV